MFQTHPDFFGGKTRIIKSIRGPYKQFRFANNYRRSESKEVRCCNCFSFWRADYHGKTYFKCEIQGISHSNSSDIRKRNICDRFHERKVNA